MDVRFGSSLFRRRSASPQLTTTPFRLQLMSHKSRNFWHVTDFGSVRSYWQRSVFSPWSCTKLPGTVFAQSRKWQQLLVTSVPRICGNASTRKDIRSNLQLWLAPSTKCWTGWKNLSNAFRDFLPTLHTTCAHL
jgi:hypothetical protein